MILYIKYMVSLRCKMLVKDELTKLGLHYVIVDLGTIEILEDITQQQRDELKKTCFYRDSNYLMTKKTF